MPASWRNNCHATGGSVPDGDPGSSWCDSEAAGLNLTPYCVTFDSSTGSRGSLCVRNKCPKGHTQYVLGTCPGEQGQRPDSQQRENRYAGWSPMPTPERRRINNCAGSAIVAQSRQREAFCSKSSTMDEATGWPTEGEGQSRPARRGGQRLESWTNFGLTSDAGQFRKCSAAKAGRCHGYFLMAGRSLAAIFILICRDVRAR
jgi:hypothetical protein